MSMGKERLTRRREDAKNFMEKLLDGVAVEWKSLGSLGTFTRGNGLQKSDFTASGVACIHYGQIYTFYGDYAYQTKSFVSPVLASKLRKAQKGDLIIATTSENIEDVCKTLVWLGDNEVCVGGETYIYKHQQNPKFLAYCLKTPLFFDFKKKNQTGAKVIRVHGDKLAEFTVPIPCPSNPQKSLEIQSEIVRILDAFTELTAELTAELKDRRKQYNYYRDRLLNFEEEGEGLTRRREDAKGRRVEWKTLGEVAELIRGNGLPKTDFTDTGIPAIHYGQIYTYYGTFTTETKSFVSEETAKKLKKVDTGDVVITNTSENLEDVGKAVVYLGQDQAVTGGHATIIKPLKDVLLGKFLAYFTQTEMFAVQKRKYAKGTKVIDVSATEMGKIIIPIPPLAEQARIVAILDKFDALTTSITEGLPREIELRQKQYEYYRNLLLSFPKPEAS